MSEQLKTNDEVLSIGIDVSDKKSQICVLSASGEVLEETKIATTKEAIHHYFGRLEPSLVTLETGTHSTWMERLLTELGHWPIVAHARELELITKSYAKTDKRDAEILARLRRADERLLKPVVHRDEVAQLYMTLVVSRDAMVRARTMLVNSLRGSVKYHGGRLRKSSAQAFHNKTWQDVPEHLQKIIAPAYESLAKLTESIKNMKKEIERACEEVFPIAQHLMDIDRVGAITALTFVLVIFDPRRFDNSDSVGAYIGAVPRKDDSGERNPKLRITKAGNGLLRKYLVQCAHQIIGNLGKDCDLKRFGERLVARGGKHAKKIAAVAVARKLAVLMHRLWARGLVYDPFHAAKQQCQAA